MVTDGTASYPHCLQIQVIPPEASLWWVPSLCVQPFLSTVMSVESPIRRYLPAAEISAKWQPHCQLTPGKVASQEWRWAGKQSSCHPLVSWEMPYMLHKEHGFGITHTWDWLVAPLFISWVTLSRWLNLSELSFLHLLCRAVVRTKDIKHKTSSMAAAMHIHRTNAGSLMNISRWHCPVRLATCVPGLHQVSPPTWNLHADEIQHCPKSSQLSLSASQSQTTQISAVSSITFSHKRQVPTMPDVSWTHPA